jgi:hypothetical protein
MSANSRPFVVFCSTGRMVFLERAGDFYGGRLDAVLLGELSAQIDRARQVLLRSGEHGEQIEQDAER